jgi:hypothetical protein
MAGNILTDTFGVPVKIGDPVAFIKSGYREMIVGVLMKVSPKGNATVHDKRGKTLYYVSTNRQSFCKLQFKELPEDVQDDINEIRDIYGYPRD